MTRLIHMVPKDRWLVWLASGWNFGTPYGLPVAEVAPGAHGAYSVMLWRYDAEEST